MKRAIGAAALGGGLLAFGAGAAGAQEVSADASARVGRSTSAEVRVCADGRVLSRLLGRCGQAASRGPGTSVQAGRGGDDSGGVRARVRVPRVASADVSLRVGPNRPRTTASADVSLGIRPNRPRTTASARAAVAPRPRAATADAAADTSPRTRADARVELAVGNGSLLDLDPLARPAGAGVLGSSLFTLVGDPAADRLLPIGELTLDGLTGEAPAGIGVLGSGPIASGNQVGADVGDVSPTVPVTICGNGVGVLGDASATCGASQPTTTGSPTRSGSSVIDLGSGAISLGSGAIDLGSGPSGSGSSPAGSAGSANAPTGAGASTTIDVSIGSASTGTDASTEANTSTATGTSTGAGTGASGSASDESLGNLASGNQVDAGIGDVSPSVPVTVCGNAVGALGDASASCGGNAQSGSGAATGPAGSSGGSTQADVVGAGNQVGVSADGVSATVPLTACGNGVGLLGDVATGCGTTSTGGITAPPPGTTPGRTDTVGTPGSPGRTDTVGTSGTPGDSGSTGTTGTAGLIPGSGGDPLTTLAPLRPFARGSGALPFTGAASDLLAMFAAALLAAGALVLRATRPAAAREGGDGR